MTAEEALDGLFVHCIAIQPADIEKSLWFYKEVLGFQETMHLKEESFEIWLLGYPAKTYPRRELARIELIHSTFLAEILRQTQQPVPNPEGPRRSGFTKLAIGVRNMPALLKRLREHNVKFVSGTGVDATEGNDEIGSLLGLEQEKPGTNETFWKLVSSVAFIRDPDDNYIELVPEP